LVLRLFVVCIHIITIVLQSISNMWPKWKFSEKWRKAADDGSEKEVLWKWTPLDTVEYNIIYCILVSSAKLISALYIIYNPKNSSPTCQLTHLFFCFLHFAIFQYVAGNFGEIWHTAHSSRHILILQIGVIFSKSKPFRVKIKKQNSVSHTIFGWYSE